jgi:CheY-like chemotaxis protein
MQSRWHRKKESEAVNVSPIEHLSEAYRKSLGCVSIRGLLVHPVLLPRKKTVLCVDDDPAELYLRCAILEANGYEVSSANCGDMGLKMMLETVFDVILLDFTMPDMDGLDVAAEARKSEMMSPILIVSGRDREELPDRVIELTNGYVKKGGSPAVLLAHIHQLTGGLPVIE